MENGPSRNGWALRKIRNSSKIQTGSRKIKKRFLAKSDSEICMTFLALINRNLLAQSIERRLVNWVSELFGKIVRKDVCPSSGEVSAGTTWGAQPKCGILTPLLCLPNRLINKEILRRCRPLLAKSRLPRCQMSRQRWGYLETSWLSLARQSGRQGRGNQDESRLP
jgi:hypothetical protein